MEKGRIYDLEERITIFGSAIIDYIDRLPNTQAGRHMAGQLVRSGTAPALHYGESQGAESSRDFIHKVRIALKEAKESRANMRMIKGSKLMPKEDALEWLLSECEELIRIMAKILVTAKKNQADQDAIDKTKGRKPS